MGAIVEDLHFAQLDPLAEKGVSREGHGRAATRDKPSLTCDDVLSTRAALPRARA